MKKPQIVVGNKIDMLSDKTEIEKLKKYFKEEGVEFIPVSLITKEGVDELLIKLKDLTKKKAEV